jgi:hypothetical protein
LCAAEATAHLGDLRRLQSRFPRHEPGHRAERAETGGSVFPFADARAAFRKMEAASHFGKIVIQF